MCHTWEGGAGGEAGRPSARPVCDNGRVRIEKPRMFQGTRDIVISLAVLLVVMAFSVGFTGMCSFNPGTPEGGPVQEVDQHTVLQMDARGLAFPVRDPAMPDGWQPNSARRVQLAGRTSTLVGWVVGGRNYISVTQTDAPLEAAVKDVDDEARQETDAETVDGTRWRRFEGDDVRPVWAADLGGARVLLEGTVSDDDFRSAAAAVTAARPLDTDGGGARSGGTASTPATTAPTAAK